MSTETTTVEPEVIGGHRINPDDNGITHVASIGLEKPKIVELDGSNQEPTEYVAGKEVTEEEKPIVCPSDDIKLNPPKDPFDLSSIPGVKEVSVNEVERPSRQEIEKIESRTTEHLKEAYSKIGDKAHAFMREMLNGGFINQFIKKFDLAGIDIEAEAERIRQKKSYLSASKRKAVMTLIEIRRQQKELLKLVGQNLQAKDSIDIMNKEAIDANKTNKNAEKPTNHPKPEEEPKPIEERKEEVPAAVQEAMEAAKVDYTPGEGGNDEVTSKALHDAVRDVGRTKYRGTFSSLKMVENPQVGDVVHLIVTDAKGNHSGEEFVYTYLGPNNWVHDGWKLEGSIRIDLPEEDGTIKLEVHE